MTSRQEPAPAGAPDRREILKLAGGVLAGVSAATSSEEAMAAPTSDITALDAVALAKAIQSRRLSCVEVMSAYLDQIEHHNPAVNASWCPWLRESLIATSCGRLSTSVEMRSQVPSVDPSSTRINSKLAPKTASALSQQRRTSSSMPCSSL